MTKLKNYLLKLYFYTVFIAIHKRLSLSKCDFGLPSRPSKRLADCLFVTLALKVLEFKKKKCSRLWSTCVSFPIFPRKSRLFFFRNACSEKTRENGLEFLRVVLVSSCSILFSNPWLQNACWFIVVRPRTGLAGDGSSNRYNSAHFVAVCFHLRR